MSVKKTLDCFAKETIDTYRLEIRHRLDIKYRLDID